MRKEYIVTEGRAGGAVQRPNGSTVGRIDFQAPGTRRPYDARLANGEPVGSHSSIDDAAVAIVERLESL